jgi:pimeloyl-ACP methyl ester carboxylesterase
MLQSSCIQDYDYSFTTRTFYIKYCDEDVELNDISVFRAEIDMDSNSAELPLKMECSLMFTDLEGKISSENVFKTFDPQNPPDFEIVASNTITFTNPLQSSSNFLPLVFDDSHYCVTNLTLHTTLIDFRFRTTPLLTPIESQNADLKDRKALTDAEVDVPGSLANLFFGDIEDVDESQVDKVYDRYMNMLINSYEKYRHLIAKLDSRCLSSKQKRKMLENLPSPYLIPPALILPFMVADSIEHSLSEDTMIQIHFSQVISTRDATEISNQIILEINMMAAYIYPLLFNFIEILKVCPSGVCMILQPDYHIHMRERWRDCVFREIRRIENYAISTESQIGEIHKNVSDIRRKDNSFRHIDPSMPQDDYMFPKSSYDLIMFEELYLKPSADEKSIDLWEASWLNTVLTPKIKGSKTHVFVLVHGFQGCSFDMRLFKNNIAVLRPDALFLSSVANENETEGDIEEMGVRLAQEVLRYIDEWCSGDSLCKISFIGHSLGGLIIRSALPHLQSLSDKMHLLLTLASPHLGYMYNTSKLVNAGLWVLKKLRKSKCLQQLSMTDKQYPEDSFLYKLSSFAGIEWFKHVALVSCWQDQYAPFESARIEMNPKAFEDPVKSLLYMEMAKNVMSRIKPDILYRLDVNFKIIGKTIDSWIGRAAHILLLENEALMRLIIYRYSNFFL